MFHFDAMAALPYRYGQPTVHCRFKVEPEDFVVTEQLGYEPAEAEQSEHLWLVVKKRGQNTAWVAKQLARHFQRPEVDIGYAGLKDRHAVTTQWFSVRLAQRERISSFVCEGVEVQRWLFSGRKLKKGELQGNSFRIRLREVSDSNALLARVAEINHAGVPNYYGSQRFGHHANNLLNAQRWFLHRYRPRGKLERGLLISAMRAWLFNLQLGFMILNDNARAAEASLAGRSRDPEPLLLQSACAGYEEQRQWLGRLGCSLASRAADVCPQIETVVEDDSVILSFDLPAGCFATAVLRELVIFDD